MKSQILILNIMMPVTTRRKPVFSQIISKMQIQKAKHLTHGLTTVLKADNSE